MKETEIYSILKENNPDTDIDVLKYAAYHLFAVSQENNLLQNHDEVIKVGRYIIQILIKYKAAFNGTKIHPYSD